MNDLALVSGCFFDLDIPPEKRYLLKYFEGDLQEQFLRYYIVFGRYAYFVEHTGFFCSSRWLKKLKKRFLQLEEVHLQAKQNAEFEKLVDIESGKYKI